jgi:hypothetical protein
MRCAAAVVLALGLALAAERAAAQTIVPVPAWLGLTFETPAAGLRAVLGDPVRVTRLPDELPAGQSTASGKPERKARYVISLQPLLFAIVTERYGAVVGIEGYSPVALTAEVPAITDPSGVALGATEEAVLRAHPDAKHMSSTLGPVIVAHAEPAGDSTATAVLVVAKNEDEGIRRETIWTRFHPCDAKTAWVKGSVATLHERGRTYDAIRYTCPPTGAVRTVYFDITPFFGKF